MRTTGGATGPSRCLRNQCSHAASCAVSSAAHPCSGGREQLMSRVLWYNRPWRRRQIVAFGDGSQRRQRVSLECQWRVRGLCSCKRELKQLETKSIAYRRHCGGTHRLLLGLTIRTEGTAEVAAGRVCARSQNGGVVMVNDRCTVGWMHVKFSAALQCARPPWSVLRDPSACLAPL